MLVLSADSAAIPVLMGVFFGSGSSGLDPYSTWLLAVKVIYR